MIMQMLRSAVLNIEAWKPLRVCIDHVMSISFAKLVCMRSTMFDVSMPFQNHDCLDQLFSKFLYVFLMFYKFYVSYDDKQLYDTMLFEYVKMKIPARLPFSLLLKFRLLLYPVYLRWRRERSPFREASRQ